MIAWLLIQENPTTGEINQTIVTEPVADVEDYAIRSGSWKDCPIEIVGVNITPLDPAYAPALKKLENRSYRSDGFVDGEGAFEAASNEDTTEALRRLREQYK